MLRKLSQIALIVIALSLVFVFFVKPMIRPKLQIIDESQLIYAGDSVETGEAGFYYLEIKEELKEWVKILTPFISAGIAYYLRGKKK